MKVSALQQTGYLRYNSLHALKKQDDLKCKEINHLHQIYKNQVIFGIANSGKLKTLFSYGLPCMYSGVEMIDPKKVQRMLKNKIFDMPVALVIKAISPFEQSFSAVEEKVYYKIKDESLNYPDKTVKELLEIIAPVYKRRLRKKQAPIFEELIEESHNLPDGFRYKFKQFMADTDRKLNDKPTIVPFSTFEFKYRLEKIREDVLKTTKDVKTIKVINKLIKEASNFSIDTNFHTIDNQKKVIKIIENVLRKSVLSKNESLNDLVSSSKSRINQTPSLVPFTRKSFIYDLGNILDKLPDKELKEKMLNIASKLPTSKESTSAYILKFMSQPSEKIVYRLLWPFMASVEHIYPKSLGGADAMSNFGGATTRENSERSNMSFVFQLKRRPLARIFCQKYVDRLIEYVKKGIFKKENINNKYIYDFKKTIQTQSKGSLILDVSELEKIEGKYELKP